MIATLTRQSMISSSIRSTLRLAAAMLFFISTPAFAQDPAAPAPAPAPDPAPAQDVPVAAPRPAQIDLNLINLPTTMSIARHHSYFRLTHRFASDLRRGDFGDQAADLFSLDKGAIIGLEYRFGITSNIQAGIHRSMLSKTIEMFGRWDALRQNGSMPVALSLTLSTEGLNNYHKNYQQAVAITASRTFGDRLALYTTPAFVSDTHAVDIISGHEGHDHDLGLDEDEHAGHSDTWFMGFGGRLRFSGTGYVTGEYTPRLHGYDPNAATWGVAVEKRTGGHTLQLNFTNNFGTTFGQLARGGNPHDIYLGFNITRRF
jgi:uncharacterized beta barrel domain-containing protein DUF5777